MWILATERNWQDYYNHEDRREAIQRWKLLMTPCHNSSQQLCITASCPGPNQRGSDLHYHHLPTIQNWNIIADMYTSGTIWHWNWDSKELLAQKETHYRLIHLPLSITIMACLIFGSLSVFLVSHDLTHLWEIMNNTNWLTKTDPETGEHRSDCQNSEGR